MPDISVQIKYFCLLKRSERRITKGNLSTAIWLMKIACKFITDICTLAQILKCTSASTEITRSSVPE